MDIKPTVNKPVNALSKGYQRTFDTAMDSKDVKLNEIDSLLSENDYALKKKIFSLAKMEALVFSDPKLSAIYEEMSNEGENKYGYHYNETIQNMIFNDYVLNSPKYLQKYKQAVPKEKKRRDKSGINQLKKTGEKMQTRNLEPKKSKPIQEIDMDETTGTGGAGDGAFSGSGQYTAPLGYAKKVDEFEEPEQLTQPEEDDCIISSNGFKYSVSCGGKFQKETVDMEEALTIVKQWQEANKWYPNIWFISDHGNASIIDIEGNIINETTGSASSGAYVGPAMWGSGDLMKTKGKAKVKTEPMISGGKIIQESKNYLIYSDGFEKFIESLNEQIDIENPGIAQKSNVKPYTNASVNNKIINDTSAFTSNTVKQWNKPDTELELHTVNNGTTDEPNLKSMKENKKIDEKAVSKKQQKFMGMVHAVQKGELSPEKVGGDVADAAKSMKKSDAEDFASTKHKGLPEKVKPKKMNEEWSDFMTNKFNLGDLPQGVDFRNVGGKYVLYYDGNNPDAKKWTMDASTKHGIPSYNINNTQIKEDAQSIISDNPNSMANKAQPIGTQSSNMDTGLRNSGGGMSESFSLLEEINNELKAFSIHQDKLKKMTEDKKPSSLILKDRLGNENEKNFKKDLQHSGTKEIIDVEKELQWKDQQTEIGKNPQKLGADIEKAALKAGDMKSGEALKNVGDSANDAGDEIPKRNLSKDEQDEVNLYRLGLGDLVYDNEVGKRFEDRMKADMGDKLYELRKKKLALRGKAPMYNKETQPTQNSKVNKSQFDKEESGWNEREGINEGIITGKYNNYIGKKKFIDFNLNEVWELRTAEPTEYLCEINFEGLGNLYTQKVNVNENFNKAITGKKFYTNGIEVFVLKNSVKNINESKLNDKPVVNEGMNKMKHLMGYNPKDFIRHNKIKW